MNRTSCCVIAGIVFGLLPLVASSSQSAEAAKRNPSEANADGRMNARGEESAAFSVPAMWEYSAPLIAPEPRETDRSHAQKDPTVVFHQGRWHVFMTVKLQGKSVIEYGSFATWEKANQSPRTILRVSDSNYYCAPQVFYFLPHRKWYLIYQVGVPGARKMWVAYSTTADIADPGSWTPARPILDGGVTDPRREGGLDYWIICDDQRAYLFLTSLNGKMWRLWTRLEDFPQGFAHCELALEARIFEASHTYRLKGRDKYLTIIEENGRRYYKAYLADRLDGPWTPVADTAERPFASWHNIRPAVGVEPWTDNVSHGELIREGCDQTMTVDPDNLQFLFQGMLDKEKAGNAYGQFSWRIGLLTPVSPSASRDRPGAAQGNADVKDFTQTDPKELGIEFVAPAKDPQTGFVVGGANATELVKGLTAINGRAIADLERDMRPGSPSEVGSDKGFLGPDESLIAVLVEDNHYILDQHRLTHQQLARHLRVLGAIGIKQNGREFLYHGSRYKVTVIHSRGYQLSPFRDGTKTNADAVIENMSNGKRLETSLLVPLMIERYGFYEGRGTPYRLDPARILEVLDFLAKPAPSTRDN